MINNANDAVSHKVNSYVTDNFKRGNSIINVKISSPVEINNDECPNLF